MKTTLLAAAAAMTLFAAPAFAQEGNGGFFGLRTPGFATVTQTTARADTGSEDTPNLNATFAQAADQTVLANNASEASVQTADSLPRGALDGNLAHAQATRPGAAARIATAAR